MWKNLIRVTVIAFVGLLAACANVQIPQIDRGERADKFIVPAAGQVAKCSIGDAVISQVTKVERSAIRLKAPYRTEWIRNSGHRAYPFTFEAGAVLTRIGTIKGVPLYAGPSTGGILGSAGMQLGAPYGIAVTDEGDVRYVYSYGGVIEETPNRKASFSKTTIKNTEGRNFRQYFLYSGRNNKELFFSYREFKSDGARPSFQQNVRYLLTEKKILNLGRSGCGC